MKIITRSTFILLVFFSIAIPFVNAQTATSTSNALTQKQNNTSPSTNIGFSQQGIFSCGGASYGSVGAQGPSGSFVPVFDSALFDQQRLLTYKVCVLDGIATKAKEAITSQIVKTSIDWANQANNGQGAFVTNQDARRLQISDSAFNDFINSPALDGLSDLDKQDIKTALKKDYAQNTRKQADALTCDELTTEQIQAIRAGDFYGGGGFQGLYKYNNNPACSKLGAYLIAKQQLYDNISTALYNDELQLNRGNGFFDQTKETTINLGNGQTTKQKTVVTPGYLIAQQLSQLLGTGLRQEESATEINALISSALANLGTRMLTDINGFSGLSTSLGGQPSYVTRLATDAVNRTRNNIVGAAAATLSNAIRNENDFYNARVAGESILQNASTQIEDWENICYADMSKSAETYVVNAVKNKVCPQSPDISIAQCSIHIDVTKTYSPDILEIHAPTPETLLVSGFTSRNDSKNIELSLISNATSTVIATIQPYTDGSWESDSINIADIPDGTITMSATEYFANDAGTYGPTTADITKTTTDGITTLQLPTQLPSLTITASANTITESVTLARDSTHSRSIIDTNIAKNSALLHNDIVNSKKALTVLLQMRDALSNTTTTSGQRQILSMLDQLVAQHSIHSSSDVQSANAQNNDIQSNTNILLDQTKTSWEGGWCQSENWIDHTVNQ